MATLETQQIDATIARTRRNMLTLGGAALAGMALTSMASAQTTTPTITDADVLNFALNLEYLEGEFYTLASSGQTVDQLGTPIAGTGTQGTVTVKPSGVASCKVPFKNTAVGNLATEIALDERNHISFLSKALGTNAVAQPKIDLYNSFNTLAALAGVGGLTSFDPFADDASFLIGAYIFEVGVSAYTGAAPLLTISSNLDAAAGIQGVEAYHYGAIRTLLYGLDQSSNMLNGQTVPAGTLQMLAQGISKLRATLDGSNSITAAAKDGDDVGLGTQQVMLNGSSNVTATSIVNCSTTGSINAPVNGTTTANSQVYARTTTQVLNIVYGGNATKPGGFFPAGLNGTIK